MAGVVVPAHQRFSAQYGVDDSLLGGLYGGSEQGVQVGVVYLGPLGRVAEGDDEVTAAMSSYPPCPGPRPPCAQCGLAGVP